MDLRELGRAVETQNLLGVVAELFLDFFLIYFLFVGRERKDNQREIGQVASSEGGEPVTTEGSKE